MRTLSLNLNKLHFILANGKSAYCSHNPFNKEFYGQPKRNRAFFLVTHSCCCVTIYKRLTFKCNIGLFRTEIELVDDVMIWLHFFDKKTSVT